MPEGVDLGDLRKIRHKNLCVVGGPCCKAFLKRAAAPGSCAAKGKGHVKHNHVPSCPQLTGLRLRARCGREVWIGEGHCKERKGKEGHVIWHVRMSLCTRLYTRPRAEWDSHVYEGVTHVPLSRRP
eukprot:2361762-Prymnesium_polylepis.1